MELNKTWEHSTCIKSKSNIEEMNDFLSSYNTKRRKSFFNTKMHYSKPSADLNMQSNYNSFSTRDASVDVLNRKINKPNLINQLNYSSQINQISPNISSYQNQISKINQSPNKFENDIYYVRDLKRLRELDDYNRRLIRNVDFYNIKYWDINSCNYTMSNSRLFKLTTRYNNRMQEYYKKDLTPFRGEWTMGTTQKVYKYRGDYKWVLKAK